MSRICLLPKSSAAARRAYTAVWMGRADGPLLQLCDRFGLQPHSTRSPSSAAADPVSSTYPDLWMMSAACKRKHIVRRYYMTPRGSCLRHSEYDERLSRRFLGVTTQRSLSDVPAEDPRLASPRAVLNDRTPLK
jgi:hypothetical protein